MDAQGGNFCLLNMPELVLENILSNIHNLTNVSRTCKYLYEIVCGMEKRRRVMCISAYDETSLLNVDAVLDSIMNSHRRIKEIELCVDDKQLNERQLERIMAIMKQFGANFTSLNFLECELPINFIVELLQQAPKLESLSFTRGKVMRSVTKNATMSLQLPSLKALEIDDISGFLHIVNLIPVGSLNSILYNDESAEVLATIFTKQHNIKSLTLEVSSQSALTALCADHLQLETLILGSDEGSRVVADRIDFVKTLKCHTNLKELRFMDNIWLSGSLFQWICNNLKKLEVFEVNWVNSIEGNAFEMLGELKQLRHIRSCDDNFLFENGFQSSQFKSESLEKFEIVSAPIFRRGELLTKMGNSLAHNLPNLTHLQMKFINFSALCFVLGHCTQVIHLISYINNPRPHQLTQQRFPNIQSLEVNFEDFNDEKKMNQNMTSIVRAMPNLKSMKLSTLGIKFDIETMKEFIKESKSLEYFYVDHFELHGELSADDVVETIRCVTEQLNGYRIGFTSPKDLKDILSNEFYVQEDDWAFFLYKGGEKKFW